MIAAQRAKTMNFIARSGRTSVLSPYKTVGRVSEQVSAISPVLTTGPAKAADSMARTRSALVRCRAWTAVQTATAKKLIACAGDDIPNSSPTMAAHWLA
jgi:hypothetical protein